MASPPSPPPCPRDPLRRLQAVMAALRGEQGCPSDREQTHRSLVPYLIEEAYELIEAIEGDDEAALREELGDVLLQVVFHAQVAAERGAFALDDVAAALADKLVQRHPHVFGDAELKTASDVGAAWHAAKMRTRDSALEGVPSALPALAWAAKVSSRAARSGFEWRHSGEIAAKAREELEEFLEAVPAQDAPPAPVDSAVEGEDAPTAKDPPTGQPAGLPTAAAAETAQHDAAELEFGDLLFALVQMARWQGIDPESALRRSTRKFITRFQRMEALLRAQGLHADKRIPEQWEALWAQAKQDVG